MSKLWWVLLPLCLGLAGWAALWLRGRAPPRRVLNAVSSLLLMAYLLVTAGLGLFWVAQQQLPVFDWHYLFGYATLLLLALHLVLNLPAAWRALRPRRVPPAASPQALHPPAAPASGRGRRVLLGAVAGLGTATVAFWFGRRHGLEAGRLEAAAQSAQAGRAGRAAVPADPAASLALVERFHALTSHSRAGLLLRAPGLAWREAPAPFKTYPGAERLRLPPVGTPAEARPGAAALGALLWHTAGVTARQGGLALRASPSSGALFSTELYVAVATMPGLPPGLWHYDAQSHALERLTGAAPDAAALGAIDAAWDGVGAAVLATAVFARTGRKYRDRAYRYVLADLGHALENLRVAARVQGLQPGITPAFDETLAAATLGVDERHEGVLALVLLRPVDGGTKPWPSAPPGTVPAPVATAPAAAPDLEAATPDELTAAVHRATSWRWASAPGPAAPRAAAAPVPGAGPPVVLPGESVMTLPPAAVLQQIAGRRSRRRYGDAPLPLDGLAALLAGLRLDDAVLSPALRVDLVVHRVDGLLPGAYRYEPGGHALQPRVSTAGQPALARAAGLDQDVIGDAAALVIVSADRAVLAADPAGPARGYRHALLEAGLVGERVYLGASALGLGCCGVGAFYDDEAAQLVGADPVHEWVLHFAALGPVDA